MAATIPDSPTVPEGLSSAAKEKCLKINGDLSISNAEELRRFLIRWLGRGPVPAVDFAGVDACDTAGLQLIASLRRTTAASGESVRVAALSSAIENLAGALGVPLGELTGSEEAGGTFRANGSGS